MSNTESDASTVPQSASTADGNPAKTDENAVAEDKCAELEENNEALKRRLDDEIVAIHVRRAVAYDASAAQRNAPVAGLALSGGGIRSATFCLGLIQGLARNGILRRFDYLSTVSGGGYIGASIGRLIGMLGIVKAEGLLASGSSQVLAWLRKNGRYLTPSGARDLGMAIATLLRSSISTHFELGLLAMLVGLFAILPHALQVQFGLFDDNAWGHWPTAWWPFAIALWVLIAPGGIWAYWPLRDPVKEATQRRLESGVHVALGIAALVVTGASVLPSYQHAHGWIAGLTLAQLGFIASLGAVAWALYVGVRLARMRSSASSQETIDFTVNDLRNRLTRALRLANQWALYLLLLGLLDGLSFLLVETIQAPTWWRSLLPGALAVAGALVVGLRSMSEPLKKALSSTDADKGIWLRRAINAIGLLIGGLLLLAWTALLQWLVFFDSTSNVLFHGIAPFWCVLLVLGAVLFWIHVTRKNNESLNGSTLHGFYRARLIRAYLSIGNRIRFPNIEKPYLGVIEANSKSVVDVVQGDDISIVNYQPEVQGGPIHLVGLCLNQTVDDHGDLYNADRKGVAAIVSAAGVEIGPGEAGKWASADSAATLGQWVTISGAAVSPGAGSNTTRGWALLLYVFGVRLGYWAGALLGQSRNRPTGSATPASSDTSLLGTLRDTKSGLVLSEALASFRGRPADWWYLSDGGHFENTAVYALIKREVPFIVVADCGADPKYVFEDLENLVRKARIDFDAEIEIYTEDEAKARFGPFNDQLRVLSPEQVIDNHTRRGVLLARICYHHSDPQRRSYGTLVIVKPSLHDELDNDVLAYAGRNPAFPQQSTGDQFFDESQWESYRRLGQDVGLALTDAWLQRLPHWVQAKPGPEHDSALPRRREKIVETTPSSAASWRRTATATAIGTTLSLSVIASLAVAGWTVYDGVVKERLATATEMDEKVAATRDSFVKLRGALCNVEAARPVRECADSTQATAPIADISPLDGQSLSQVYELMKDPNYRVKLPAIVTDIEDLQQKVCGMDSSMCVKKQQTAENLCGAICDAPPENRNGEKTYWGMSSKSYDWSENALIAFVLHFFPAMHAEKSQQGSAVSAPGAPTDSRIDASDSAASSTAPAAAPPPMDADEDTQASSDTQATAAAASTANSSGETSFPPLPAAASAPSHAVVVSVPPPVATPEPIATGTPRSSAAGDTSKSFDIAPGELRDCLIDREPMALYIQIYDERMRDAADSIRAGLKASKSVVVPRIENVTATANARGSRIPTPWKTPTLLVHRPDQDMKCATDIARILGKTIQRNYPGAALQVRELPSSFKSTQHVLELWLSPAASGEVDQN